MAKKPLPSHLGVFTQTQMYSGQKNRLRNSLLDLGCEVIVQLINGKEVTEYKDDVVICE